VAPTTATSASKTRALPRFAICPDSVTLG
jgi:hypothetical protein